VSSYLTLLLAPAAVPPPPLLCCPSDPWVMREWSIKLNNDLHKVAMLADGEATWHARLGECGLQKGGG
jgi:peroxiredoxin